jgi:hypothetical protein
MVLEVPLESGLVEAENIVQGASGWQNIMTDGFEVTFPGSKWQLFGDPTWGKDGYRRHSGSYSAFCAKSGSAGVNPPAHYPDNMEAWMIYGPFDLSDASDAELNFYYWLKSEYNYDYLEWMASTDGDQFYGSARGGNSFGWVSQSFDLTDVYTLGDLCGEPQVWIAFVFESDGEITDEGAFIDDVVLRKYVPAVNSPPNTPSNPSPPNHGIGIAINTDLDWMGGDPDPGDTVTYDVYFGTSATPPKVSDNQAGTSYDTGGLGYNTKYYWKILANDGELETTGPLWDFTTTAAGGDCPWLDENPKSGTVEPAGSDSITVTINSAGLADGDYSAQIVISSNDPDENPKVLSVTLHVRPILGWNLPWGLDADASAVNIWTYPETAVQVTLASLEGSMPDGLLIWHYGGPVDGWQFYKKGWGTVNTLASLVPGEGYIAIVPAAAVWEIPQV